MYKRTWTPTETKTDYTGRITFYDSGIVCGELFNDAWCSWEILDRVKNGDTIIETLRELSQDYIPFEVLHIETHEAMEDYMGNVHIPGWIITYDKFSPSSQQPLLQTSPLEPCQPADQLKTPPVKQTQPLVQRGSQPAPRPPPRPRIPEPWVPPETLEVLKQDQTHSVEQPSQMMKVLPSSGKTVQKPMKSSRPNRHQENQKKRLPPVEAPPLSYPPHLQPLVETLLTPSLSYLAPSSSPQQKKVSQPVPSLQAGSPAVKGVRQKSPRRSQKHMKQEVFLAALVDNPSTLIGQK